MKNYLSWNTKIETREGNGKKYIIGIIPYNQPSVEMYGVIEYIRNSAFVKTIVESDIKALWNHDSTLILGRLKNNSLTLENSISGLVCTLEVPNTTFGNDCYELIRSGTVTGLSFGFDAVKDAYDYATTPVTRELLECKLYEISFGVSFPAYESTNAITEIRSIYEGKNINFDKLNAIVRKNTTEISESDKHDLEQYIESLRSLLPKNNESKQHLKSDTVTNPPLEEIKPEIRQQDAPLQAEPLEDLELRNMKLKLMYL